MGSAKCARSTQASFVCHDIPEVWRYPCDWDENVLQPEAFFLQRLAADGSDSGATKKRRGELCLLAST